MKKKFTKVFNRNDINVLYKRCFTLFLCFCFTSLSSLNAQQHTVSGVVTDDTDTPLAGVTVRIDGTNAGTITDLVGRYSISVNPEQSLEFSFIGMEKQIIAVGTQRKIDVTLKTDVSQISDILVIGYGTAKKRDLTGSIVSISAKEISDRPSSNAIASLQGKVAGMQVINTGRVGEDPEVRIRGTNSINGFKPIYIVDGLFTDNINYINSADIASIEVLKDPSSLAIFGISGANGVIIVTTKKADKGEVVINLNSSIGFRKVNKKIDVANGSLFKELYDEQQKNRSLPPFDYSKYDGNTDWQDAMFQTGFMTNNNISVAGSSDKSHFYMGLGYNSQEGIIKHEKMERITLNLSSDFRVTRYLKFGFQVNGSRMLPPDAKSASGALTAAPISPVTIDYEDPFTHKVEKLFYAMPDFQRAQVSNPMMGVELLKRHNKATNYRINGNIFGEIDFHRTINFRATFSMDYRNDQNRRYSPIIYQYNPDMDGVVKKELLTERESVSQAKSTFISTQADYVLTYKDEFGNGHSINATLGFTTKYNDYSGISVGRSQHLDDIDFSIPSDNPDKWWISSIGSKNITNGGSQWRRFTMSYLMRALYSYKERYLLNVSYRRDGSSVFKNSGNTWDNFYSFGAGWIMTEENFMKQQNIINYLKIKGSWGLLGIENTGGNNYPTYPNLVAGSYAVFGDYEIPTWREAYILKKLGWERVQAWEIGFEALFLKNRLRIEPTYYNKLSKDIIVLNAPFAGAHNSLDNAGEIENKGFELAVSWNDRIGKDFTYKVSANITTISNKVRKLGYGDNFALYSGSSRTLVGYPIGHFYGYIVEGVYQNDEDIYQSPINKVSTVTPGDLKFKDIDGDGYITPQDRTNIGNPTPKFMYGYSVNLAYKGFDLGVDMMGRYGGDICRTWDKRTDAQINYLKGRKNRWHGEGTSNWEPILNPDRSINYQSSNYYVEDGSYFRISNIQLGYTFDKKLIQKIHLKSVRIFANIQNLHTWSKNTGYVPEIGGSALAFGIDQGTYPMPAVYTFGVNITF